VGLSSPFILGFRTLMMVYEMFIVGFKTLLMIYDFFFGCQDSYDGL